MNLFRRSGDKPKPRAVVIVARLPDFQQASQNPRLAQRVLNELGYEVTLLSRKAVQGAWFVEEMKQAGVETYVTEGSLPGAISLPDVERWLAKSKFDLAFIFAWNVARQFLPMVRKANPNCRVIVSTVDLAFIRQARGDTHRHPGQARPNPISEQTARRMMMELNVYAESDALITVSQFEADVIEALLSNPGITRYVPWVVSAAASGIPPAERSGLLLLGRFNRDSNLDAARYFFEQIVPLIDPARLAKHPIRIVGMHAKTELAAFAHRPYVEMIGEVPLIQPYYDQALINVVPLRYGAGIKQKVVEASLAGLPTVTTSIGIEALPLRPGEDVLVADDPRAFADAIHRLMDDVALWERLAVGARASISGAHDAEAARAALREVILMAADKAQP